MKNWFKYKGGYVNIENDMIYLTKTGNWSEVKEMAEKNHESVPVRYRKELYWTIFILISSCVFGLLAYSKVLDFEFYFLALFLLIMSSHQISRIIKKKLSPQLKVPISKINDFKLIDETIKLTVINEAGVERVYMIDKIDDKGRRLMNSIMERWETLKNH